MVKDQKELISVVIPTYNREHVIKRCIDSVITQTYCNIEVIVVDDASTDNTHKVMETIKDSRVRYIKLVENSRGTLPRNVGIDDSNGKFIAFLDSDDTWLPNKLEEQLKYINQSEYKQILCFTGVLLKNGEKEKKIVKRDLRKEESIIEYIINVGWVQCSTFMGSSDVIKQTKFNSTLKKHQDWDFCYRLSKNNTSFLYVDKDLTVYNMDDTNNQISGNQRYDLSLNWIDSIKSEISLKNYYTFLFKNVTKNMMLSGNNKAARDIYLEAIRQNSISFSDLCKGFLKWVNVLIISRK